MWDTAGQERFDSLTKLYYNGASAALICVDLTDSSSYSKAQFWVRLTSIHIRFKRQSHESSPKDQQLCRTASKGNKFGMNTQAKCLRTFICGDCQCSPFLQAKELKKHQPSCSCYVVITKSDLLDLSSRAIPSPSKESRCPSRESQRCEQSIHRQEDETVESKEGQTQTRCLDNPKDSPRQASDGSPTGPFERRFSSDTSDKSGNTGPRFVAQASA